MLVLRLAVSRFEGAFHGILNNYCVTLSTANPCSAVIAPLEDESDCSSGAVFFFSFLWCGAMVAAATFFEIQVLLFSQFHRYTVQSWRRFVVVGLSAELDPNPIHFHNTIFNTIFCYLLPLVYLLLVSGPCQKRVIRALAWMLSLQHGSLKALAAKRNPIDLVLIIDVSFSMSSAMEDAPCCRSISECS